MITDLVSSLSDSLCHADAHVAHIPPATGAAKFGKITNDLSQLNRLRRLRGV
jgi:hypothetical protein